MLTREQCEDIGRALETMRQGGVVLYPTDTIWGLGCDATNPEAVAKVYAMKAKACPTGTISSAGTKKKCTADTAACATSHSMKTKATP